MLHRNGKGWDYSSLRKYTTSSLRKYTTTRERMARVKGTREGMKILILARDFHIQVIWVDSS